MAVSTTGNQTLKHINKFQYVYTDGLLTRAKITTTRTDDQVVNDRLMRFFYDAGGVPASMSFNGTFYYYATNAQGDVVAILNNSGVAVVEYSYDAWGNILSVTGELANGIGKINPLRYRGYVYDTETGLYYLQSRYYNPKTGRFINADNNFSGINLFLYCGNNPVCAIDPNGEHWYYLWLDDLWQGVNELLASASNIVYGNAAMNLSVVNPQAAKDLYSSRPFQDIQPSPEVQMFTNFMYANDFVSDISVSINTPDNTYVKVGVSNVLSAGKNIDATYFHVGFGKSISKSIPEMPASCTYSVGIVRGMRQPSDYSKDFLDFGTMMIYGWDYCFWPNGSPAYCFTISTSFGAYAGYDYYWCLN